MQQVYSLLESLDDLLPQARAEDRTTSAVLHATSPRGTQTVALGGYLFRATLARTWPARTLATDDGAMLVLQLAPDDFLILGAGLTVTPARDPDTDNRTAGILSIDEVTRDHGQLTILRHLTGDENNQNRDLMMDPKRFALYRVKLYTAPQP